MLSDYVMKMLKADELCPPTFEHHVSVACSPLHAEFADAMAVRVAIHCNELHTLHTLQLGCKDGSDGSNSVDLMRKLEDAKLCDTFELTVIPELPVYGLHAEPYYSNETHLVPMAKPSDRAGLEHPFILGDTTNGVSGKQRINLAKRAMFSRAAVEFLKRFTGLDGMPSGANGYCRWGLIIDDYECTLNRFYQGLHRSSMGVCHVAIYLRYLAAVALMQANGYNRKWSCASLGATHSPYERKEGMCNPHAPWWTDQECEGKLPTSFPQKGVFDLAPISCAHTRLNSSHFNQAEQLVMYSAFASARAALVKRCTAHSSLFIINCSSHAAVSTCHYITGRASPSPLPLLYRAVFSTVEDVARFHRQFFSSPPVLTSLLNFGPMRIVGIGRCVTSYTKNGVAANHNYSRLMSLIYFQCHYSTWHPTRVMACIWGLTVGDNGASCGGKLHAFQSDLPRQPKNREKEMCYRLAAAEVECANELHCVPFLQFLDSFRSSGWCCCRGEVVANRSSHVQRW